MDGKSEKTNPTEGMTPEEIRNYYDSLMHSMVGEQQATKEASKGKLVAQRKIIEESVVEVPVAPKGRSRQEVLKELEVKGLNSVGVQPEDNAMGGGFDAKRTVTDLNIGQKGVL